MNPGHLIQQVHEQPVETRPAICIVPAQRLNQLKEARKYTLLVHHLESRFILPTVEEQERCDEV